MRIMAGNNTKFNFLTSTEAFQRWGLFFRTVNIILNC